jgi:hypothetical protein
MATDATIQRWDNILSEAEIKRQCFVSPIEVLVPGHVRFQQGFQVVVDALTKSVMDAWESDRPAEGSALYVNFPRFPEDFSIWDRCLRVGG